MNGATEYKIGEGKLDDREVRAALDAMTIEEVMGVLGDPHIDTHYAEAPGWKQGQPRPVLASTEPAVMQAIGRCAASRVRGDMSRALPGGVHPRPCGWCDYPLPELLAACSWAVWWSRSVVSETVTWAGANGSHYTRPGRHNVFTNPIDAEYWQLPPRERAALVESAIERSRE